MSGSAAAGGPNGGAPGAGALNAKAALDAPPPAAAAAAPQAALAAVPFAGAGERAAGAGHGTAAGPAPQPSRIRSASPRPKKRQRSVAASPAATTPTAHHAGVGGEEAEDGGGGQEEGGDPGNPFYLKHQNRALASELRAYKGQIDRLVAERDYRRAQCDGARVALDRLAGLWAEVEAAVGIGLRGLNLASGDLVAASVKTEEGIKAEGDGSRVVPPSTGSGGSVESVPSLVAALIRLADSPLDLAAPKKEGGGDGGMDVDDVDGGDQDERDDLDALSRSSASLASRAEAFRSALVPLLGSALAGRDLAAMEAPGAGDPLLEPAGLRREIETLRGSIREAESRVAELVRARDEGARAERRVRRGLYRLASGRDKIGEVMKAVNMEDGSVLFEKYAKEVAEEMAASATATAAIQVPAASSSTQVPAGKDSGPVDSAEVGKLRKRMQDLEEIADSREKRIAGLLMEREDCLKQINDLRLAKTDMHKLEVSADDVKRSELFTETAVKLAKAEARSAQLQKSFEDMNKKWATAKADHSLTKKALSDMEEKHIKRLEEIATAAASTSKDRSGAETNGSSSAYASSGEKVYITEAKTIAELEHKLNQALEAVRQAESAREALSEANGMNEAMSSKLDEYKQKNAALQASKDAARATELLSDPSKSIALSEKDKAAFDKLFKDHRRLQKELKNALAVKDNARAKQDRAEKERDALMKSNVRLVAQSTDKDEMNAASLSTILHLNQLTEQLKQEKEILEQKAKASEQLSLSARLAAHAKERVDEETVKEKELDQKDLEDTKEQCGTLIAELEEINAKLTQSKAEVSIIAKDLGVAKNRCDELVKESTVAEEEKSRLMDSLAVARKEADEATKEAANAAAHVAASGSKGGGTSAFTMDQMETHVKILKGRLTCNVCNERDKNTILLRCRHMFCRQCVDINIKNRSRKCPGCGQRFDMKEVADIWL